MKKIIITIIVLFFSSVALADREALPRAYKVISSDKQYVFVMLPSRLTDILLDSEGIPLRIKYKKSGLYKNNGAKDPLWTVDWYSYQVFVMSDGKHIIRMGQWPRLWDIKHLEPGGSALKQLAVAFYKEGKPLKEYAIADLIDKPKNLPKSVSHFQWKKNISFDEKQGRLTINTLEGKEFLFDIYSGEIIQKR